MSISIVLIRHRKGMINMKVAEIKISRKTLDIEVYTKKNGSKFIKAKCVSIYGKLLEVRLYKMYDGVIFAYEINNNLIDEETLTELKKAMMKLREQYCTERNR